MNHWQQIAKTWLHPEWEDTLQGWYSWLQEMKKDEEMKEEEHQKLVSRMIARAEGGLLHKVTKPTAWIGGGQVLEEGESLAVQHEGARSEGHAQRKLWAPFNSPCGLSCACQLLPNPLNRSLPSPTCVASLTVMFFHPPVSIGAYSVQTHFIVSLTKFRR